MWLRDENNCPCPVAGRWRGGTSLLLLGALLGVGGCTSTGDRARVSGLFATAGDVKLSDARSLDDFDIDDNVQVNLTDKLSPPLAVMEVYFGEADAYRDDDDSDSGTTAASPAAAIPVIAMQLGDQWKAVAVSGPGLGDAGWKYVGAGPGLREVWGVLDTSAGDSQGNFVLAHSTDGALSFALKEFRKPCKLATVFDFAMNRSGRGGVTLSLDADCGSHKAGLYHYETTDDGKNWSKIPRFEADAMIRADAVSDDEQPAPAVKPLRTLYFHRHHSRRASKRWIGQ
jgi:hypothetical protein